MANYRKRTKLKRSFKKTGRNFDDPEYKKWRKAIYQRDEYKCQFPACKYRGRKVEAHHIKTWAENPILRYNLDNGISLCRKCHRKITRKERLYESLFREIVRHKNKHGYES